MPKQKASQNTYTSPEITNIFQEISGNTDLASIFWIGSAIEFAYHKDVNWLFFGKGILQDPILRVIISAHYQKKFAFGPPAIQQHVARQIRNFHTPLEQKRGFVIPSEAYRDVLMMIIDMGERTYELMHGPMNYEQRLEYFETCRTMGQWMDIPNLPHSYQEYQSMREASLHHNYQPTEYADKLFQSYRSHFGPLRYYIVERIMAQLSPTPLKPFHQFKTGHLFPLILKLYRRIRNKHTIALLERILIPRRYRRQAHAINIWS